MPKKPDNYIPPGFYCYDWIDKPGKKPPPWDVAVCSHYRASRGNRDARCALLNCLVEDQTKAAGCPRLGEAWEELESEFMKMRKFTAFQIFLSYAMVFISALVVLALALGIGVWLFGVVLR